MNEASHNAWMNLPEHWRQRRQSKRHSSLQRWEDMIAYQEKHSFLLLLKNFSLASSYTCLKHFVDKNFYQISQFNSLKWLNKGSLHTSIFYRKSYTTPKHNTFHSHTCQSCQFPQIIMILKKEKKKNQVKISLAPFYGGVIQSVVCHLADLFALSPKHTQASTTHLCPTIGSCTQRVHLLDQHAQQLLNQGSLWRQQG